MTTNPIEPAIRAIGLRKSFGDHVVLDGIDLIVPEGTIFALLGPNGAGKTTTVQILSTLIGADGGEVRIAGHDLAADPDSVRAELYKILAEARAAQKLPWEPKTVRLYRTIFPQMTNWLPDEEGAQLRFEFEAEIRRLEAA